MTGLEIASLCGSLVLFTSLSLVFKRLIQLMRMISGLVDAMELRMEIVELLLDHIKADKQSYELFKEQKMRKLIGMFEQDGKMLDLAMKGEKKWKKKK